MNTILEISNKITQCSQHDRLEIIISLRAFLFDSPVYYWIDFTYSKDYEKDLINCQNLSPAIFKKINEDNIKRMKETIPSAEFIDPNVFYSTNMDIYAPCALGGTINDDTLAELKCGIIAGAANNQLAEEVRDGQLCSDNGLVYAPDFLINAGGLINVYSEIKGYDKEHAINQTREIYNTTLEILKKSELEDMTTHAAALEIAEQRINNRKNA